MDKPRLEMKPNGRRLVAERLAFHIDQIQRGHEQTFAAGK
jgi:hypothetical protein